MWQRFTLYDFRVIGHYLGVLLVFEAVAMAAPVLVALIFQEWNPASRYLLGAGIALTLGTGLRMLRISPGRLSRQQAIGVTGFAWIVLSAVSAIPLAMSMHYDSYPNALFDAVSAFTTTDASVLVDINHVSHSDNMWRFIMNFVGGVGLVVVAMSFGIMGNSTSSLYSSEGRGEHVLPNVVQTARFIFRFAISVILIATILIGTVLLVLGMQPDRAYLHGIWLAMASFMTAGLTPMATSVTYYHSLAVEGILMVLMVYGGINFALQNEIWHGRPRMFLRDNEVQAGVVWWLVMLLVFITAACGSALANGLPVLMRTGLFTFVSAATTTGFTMFTSNQLAVLYPSGAVLVLALVMAVGASAGSTAGGIKLNRIAIVVKSAVETMRSTVSPDSARIVTNYSHIGKRRLGEDEVKAAMTVLILFISTYAIGALAGIAYGYDATSAITESVAMASNSGMSTGIVSPVMPEGLRVIYILEMWAGRLEFVTLLALACKIFVSVKPRGLGRRRRG